MEYTRKAMDAICLAMKLLLENGGETYRAEDTAIHMARGFGLENTEVFAMPTGVMLTASKGEETLTRIVRVHSKGIDLSCINDCNTVSRLTDAGKLDPDGAICRLKEIGERKKPGLWLLVLACALSSGFFSVMFDGRLMEAAVAFLCGAVCQLCMRFFAIRRLPGPLVSLAMSFLITLVALLCTLICPGLSTSSAVAGALMPLVPGIALTSAIRDTLKGDLVSGGARVLDAMLTAIMLAVGAGLMLNMWNGALVPSLTAIPVVQKLIACFIATLSFSLLFNQPRGTMLFSAAAGTAGYGLFLLTGQNTLAYFLATLAIGVVCELIARLIRCPATLLITSGIIPMVPGLGLYTTMLQLNQGEYEAAVNTGVATVSAILVMALAVTFSSIIFVGTHGGGRMNGRSRTGRQ